MRNFLYLTLSLFIFNDPTQLSSECSNISICICLYMILFTSICLHTPARPAQTTHSGPSQHNNCSFFYWNIIVNQTVACLAPTLIVLLFHWWLGSEAQDMRFAKIKTKIISWLNFLSSKRRFQSGPLEIQCLMRANIRLRRGMR